MGLRGIFAGALALIALQTLVSTSGAANRAGGALTGIAGIVDRALNPSIAAIPDRRNPSNASTTAAVYRQPAAPTTAPPTTRTPTPTPPRTLIV